MIRKLGLGAGILVTAGIAATAVVVVYEPSGEEEIVEQADASPTEMGVCKVSVSNIPEGVEVSPVSWPAPGNLASAANTITGERMYLLLQVPLPADQPHNTFNPATGFYEDVTSRITIDAVTGEVTGERYRTPDEEAMLGSVLSTLRVASWEPSSEAWPRTDTTPRGEIVDPPRDNAVQFRQPDASSGMLVSFLSSDTVSKIIAYTCDSVVEVNATSGTVIRSDVVPGEQAMFQRFLREIQGP